MKLISIISSDKMMNTFIYALCEPGTRTIRYIGKSGNPRKRFFEHLDKSFRNRKPTHRSNWIDKLKIQGQSPELLILKEVPLSEWEWWEQDRKSTCLNSSHGY